jgi:hypothetical protein
MPAAAAAPLTGPARQPARQPTKQTVLQGSPYCIARYATALHIPFRLCMCICGAACMPGICVELPLCAAYASRYGYILACIGPMCAAMHVMCAVGVVQCETTVLSCVPTAAPCAAQHLLLLLFSARAVCIAVQAAAGHCCHVDTTPAVEDAIAGLEPSSACRQQGLQHAATLAVSWLSVASC